MEPPTSEEPPPTRTHDGANGPKGDASSVPSSEPPVNGLEDAASGHDLVLRLRIDQRERWRRGDRVFVEAYLQQHPELLANPEDVLDLIYGEVVLRQERGEAVSLDGYLERFGEYERALRRQFELEEMLAQGLLPSEEHGPVPPLPTLPSPLTGHTLATQPDSPGGSATPPAATPANGTAAPAARWPAVPGYEILGVLGQGGMGIVYKAWQVRPGRVVALKMISRAGEISHADLQRFRGEAEALARLQHPNVVQVYQVGESADGPDQLPFFSLEFCDGGSLTSRLKGAPLLPRAAADLVEALARAVHAAHQANVIHRDLKPANVLLAAGRRPARPPAAGCLLRSTDAKGTDRGQEETDPLAEYVPKLTDFGLAKKLDEPSLSRSGAVMGTPPYMAPEQARGDGSQVGPAADVYGLGAILYELLTGRPPFRAATTAATIRQVLHDEPVPPRRLQPGTPRDLEAVCLKCLEKDPARRYPSAGELADDLVRFAEGRPTRARPVGPLGRLTRWARRRPAAAALLALLVVLAAGAATWGGREVRLQQHRARLRVSTQDLVVRGQGEMVGGRWEQARPPLETARALAEAEPSLLDLVPGIEQMLKECDSKLAEVREQGKAQERWQQFHRLCERVMFREALFTGLGQQARALETRAEARQALADLGVTLESQGPPVPWPHLTAEQEAEVLPRCYELLLSWAEAVAQPASKDERPEVQASEALRILDRAAELGPRTRAWHTRRARYFAQKGDAQAALAERTVAQKTRPDGAVDYFLLGMEEYNLRLYRQARDHLALALELRPDHFWVGYGLAMCQIELKNPEAAKTSLTACLSRQKMVLWPYLLRGYIHTILHDFPAAEKDFALADQLLEGEPAPSRRDARYGILVNHGLMYLEQEKVERTKAHPDEKAADALLEKATTEFEKAADLQPEQYQAHANWAEACRRLKKLDEACDHLRRAINCNRQSANLYRLLAHAELQRKAPEAALEALNAAIACEPGGVKSEAKAADLLERGRILLGKRHFETALREIDRAIAVHPGEYPAAQRLRAQALVSIALASGEDGPQQNYRDAIRAIDRYLQLVEQSPRLKDEPVGDAYRIRGQARSKLRDYAGAVQDYTGALEADRRQGRPADGPTLCLRGWAFLTLEAPQPARVDFRTAVELDKANADAHNGLGFALVLTGDYREAVKEANQAVAEAEKPDKKGPVNRQQFYKAARTFAQAYARAQAVAGGDITRLREAADYRRRALELLEKAVQQTEAAQRARFWKKIVRRDSALRPLHGDPAFREIEDRYVREAP